MKSGNQIKTPLMSPVEVIACSGYLPAHIFLIPLFLGIYMDVSGSSMTSSAQNAIYYAIGIAFTLIFTHGFLRRGFDTFLDNAWRSVFNVALGYVVCFLLNYLVFFAMLYFIGDISNPNDEAVRGIAQENFTVMFIISVIMCPVVEETLFRGFLFGTIRRKNRILAYILSIGVFAFYHVWQYLVIYMDARMLVYMLQYIPAGFVLAWCYDRSGTVWAPILLHMAINAAGMLA